MSVIEILVERISQDISCEKEVVVLEVIDNPQHIAISVVQSVGESQSAVMSQKAVTDELSSLVSALQAEAQDRIDSDDALSAALQEEIQFRVEAVNTLSSALQEEVQNREDADNTLTSALQVETQDRISADNALTSALQEESQDRVEAVNALASVLQAETQDRIDADAILTSEIQRIQQEHNQALLDLKAQMESDLSSLRGELIQHLNYAVYLNLPLGGTK